MKNLLKSIASGLLGSYALYVVGRIRTNRRLPVPSGVVLVEVTAAELRACPEPELNGSAWYLGTHARAFACMAEGHILALACCWWGGRYAARHSWPLSEGEAKLVHLVTLPAARGRGLAPILIQYTEACMRADGFNNLYARIWFNNLPSLRAFERAGWQKVGYWVELNPLRRQKPWRLRWPP